MKRVVVVGTSCSGKTTFAGKLANRLGIKHVELDEIYWMKDWQGRPVDEFRRMVLQEAERDSWVIEGNYRKVRDILWNRADTLVWLNYPFSLVFYRAITRTLRRVFRKEVICGGNTESFYLAFLSPESIPRWVLKTYWKRKKEYSQLMKSNEFPNMKRIELQSKKSASKLLENLDVNSY